MLQRAIAEEVDPLVGEIELHLLRRFLRHAAGAEHGLLRPRHLRRLLQVQVALLDQLLHDLIEQIGQLFLQLGVFLCVAGRIAAQHVEHLGCELTRVHQRLEDRLAQRVE